MRNNIVAGNWKMNNDATQTTALINDLNKALEGFQLIVEF